MSRLVPLMTLANMDPAGVPNTRVRSAYEIRVIQNNPLALWLLLDTTSQRYMWDYESDKWGNYEGVVRQNGSWLSSGASDSVKFTTPAQFIHVPGDTDLDTAAQTYEMWVRPTAPGVLLARDGLFELSITATNVTLDITGYGTLTGAVPDLYNDQWHLIAFTLGATDNTLYYDGDNVLDTGAAGALPAPGTDLYFGRVATGSTDYRGGMAAPAFFPSELLPLDLEEHYSIGSTIKYSDVVEADNPMFWVRLLTSKGAESDPATLTEQIQNVVLTKYATPNIGYARMAHIVGDTDTLICLTEAGQYSSHPQTSEGSQSYSPTGSMTYEIWVTAFTRSSIKDSNPRTFYNAYRNDSNPRIYYYGASSSDANRGFRVSIDAGPNELAYVFTPAEGLVFGRPYHIAMVHVDGGLNNIYVNGELKASNAASTGYTIDESKLSIGGDIGAYAGKLVESEYAVYNHALTQERVLLRYLAVTQAKMSSPYHSFELSVMQDNPAAFYRWSAGRALGTRGCVDVSDNDRTIGDSQTVNKTWTDCTYDPIYGYSVDYSQTAGSTTKSIEFLSLYQFSIEMTIKVNGLHAGASRLFWKIADTTDTANSFDMDQGGLYVDLTSTDNASIPGALGIAVRHHSDTANRRAFATPFPVDMTRTLCLGFTYDGVSGDMEFYINGVPSGTNTLGFSGDLKASGNAAVYPSFTDSRPNGELTDMVVYSGILGADRFEAHARAAGLYVL